MAACARDAGEQFGELDGGNLQHGEPPSKCADVSIPLVFSWKRPGNLGVTDGRLAPSRRTPNCVSSQADPADRVHFIAPIPFAGDAAAAIAAARRAVEGMRRSTVIREAPGYLYAEFRSRLLGFVDDVEFAFDGRAGVLHVRSSSRLGQRDYGVNRARVESLRRRIAGGAGS
ncbi:MAG: DUF1499 domain-containing protein [Betaproteobacteria bacterium]|nr:DUF1499 domain-containing protein [Betaproteobacteria bacterium]